MNTVEDFRNAPVGATATRTDGGRAVKIDDVEQRWAIPSGVYYLNNEGMVYQNYTLDTPTPTTAREALDLAWELAHEVKEGQVIPKGTQYLTPSDSGLKGYTTASDFKITPAHATVIRTLEPLPDPEPDWLDAPAVLAGFDGWDHDEREVFVPTGAPDLWERTSTDSTFHWSELMDVTPLYPKENE